MAKKIGSQDLFEANLFLKEKENAEALLITLQKLEDEYKDILKVNNEIIKQSDTKSVEGLKKREQAVKAVTTAEKEMQKIEKALVTAEEKLNLSRSEANKKLQETRVKTNAVNKELRDNAKRTLESGNAYKKLSARVNDASAKFKRLSAEFGINSKQARKAKKELDRVQKELREIDVAAKDGRRNVGNYGTALGGLGKRLKGIGLRFVAFTTLVYGLGRAIVGSVRTFKDFQQANANLAAVLGKSRKDIKALSEDAKRLGATTAFTASQVTELQVAFSKLGFSESQILSATEATLALAAATGTDLGESATVAASTINAFGLEAEDTQRIVDVMAKSFSSSALDMSKFSTAMAIVGPVAKTSGVSIERTTALIGTLADAGIDASTAGTGLRNIFLDLTKHGLTFEEAMEKISNSSDKNATALDLFGKRGATVATVLADNTEKADELSEAFQRAGGSAQAMADEQLDTLQGSVTKLSSAWEGFILSLEDGDGVISRVLRGAIDMATEFLNVLTEMNMSSAEIRQMDLGDKFEEGISSANAKMMEFNETLQLSDKDLAKLGTRYSSFVKDLREEGISDIATQELLSIVKASEEVVDELDNLKVEEEKIVKDRNDLMTEINKEIEENGKVVNGNLQRQKHEMVDNADLIDQSVNDVAESIHKANGELEAYSKQLQTLIQNKTVEDLVAITNDASIANNEYGRELVKIAKLELQRRSDIGENTELLDENTDATNSNNSAKQKQLELLKKIKEEQQRLNDEETVFQFIRDKNQDAMENEIDDVITHYDKLFELARDNAEQEKELQELLMQDINAIIEKYQKQELNLRTKQANEKKKLLEDEAKARNKEEANRREGRKKEQKQELEFLQERIDASVAFYQTLAELSTERIEKEQHNIDKEIEASRSRQEQLAQIANQGQLDAQQSLAAEIRREAELERQKQQLERRKIRRQTISKGLELLSANLNAGQNGGDAVATSIRQLTGFIALLSNLPGFYKGTENAPEGYAWTDEKGAEIHLDKHGNIKDLGSQGGARIKYLEKGDKILTAQESKIVKSQMGVQPHIEAREIRIQQRALSGQKYIVDGLRNVVKAVDEKPVQSFEYDEINKAVIDQMTSRSSVERKHQSNKPKFM